MPTTARDREGQRGWGRSFTGPVGDESAQADATRVHIRCALGLVAPEAEAAFMTPPLPRASRKKGALPLVSVVSWTRPAPRSLPKPGNGRDGHAKFITKYSRYLQLCGGRFLVPWWAPGYLYNTAAVS
jgi:hypothetical protein